MAELQLIDDQPKGTPEAPEEERMQLKHLWNLFKASSERKKASTQWWKESYEFYRLRHWEARPEWKASPTIPLIHGKVQTVVPLMTDSRPRVHILPREPEYEEYADDMQKLLDYEWDTQHMDRVVELSSENALIFGDGFWFCWWDPKKKKITTDLIDPESLFPDPRAVDMQNSRYLIHRTRMSIADIKKRPWNRVNNVQLKPGVKFTDEQDVQETREQHRGTPDRIDAIVGTLEPGVIDEFQDVPPAGRSSEMQELEVLQYWIRDLSVVEKVVKDANGTAVFKALNPKFKGQMRHIVVAGNRIVHDAGHPYTHGRYPYIKQACYPFPNEFWSVSMAENLISLNKVANKMFGLMLDNAALMASTQWKVSKQAQVDPELLTGEPGLVVEYNALGGGVVEKMESKPLPAYVAHILELALRLTDDTSGIFDVTQGRKPSGIQAGVAIESLQDASHTRVRLLVRHLEDSIREWGEQVVALHQQFVTEDKVIRSTDLQTGEFKFITLTPKVIKAQWEVLVVAGSTLPRSRDTRQREALALFEAQLFDPEETLKYIEHPGAERLLARLNQQKAVQTDLQLRGLGQTQPGGGGGGAAQAGPPPLRRPQVSNRGGGFNNQG